LKKFPRKENTQNFKTSECIGYTANSFCQTDFTKKREKNKKKVHFVCKIAVTIKISIPNSEQAVFGFLLEDFSKLFSKIFSKISPIFFRFV